MRKAYSIVGIRYFSRRNLIGIGIRPTVLVVKYLFGFFAVYWSSDENKVIRIAKCDAFLIQVSHLVIQVSHRKYL